MTDVDTFLEGFFGTGNSLDAGDERVTPLVDAVLGGWPEVPVALPRVGDTRSKGAVRWYVVSPAPVEDARLAEELSAWVGPTYTSSWVGRPSALDLSDPVDRAVSALSGGAVFLVDVDETNRERVRTNLERLRQLWAERPPERSGIPRRISELVRDVELSLANGNPQTARSLLGELARRGLLTAENELFLEVAILEAEARWLDLASHPRIADISARRRPWTVTRSLLRGLYRSELAEAESDGDLDPWIRRAAEPADSYPGLFSTRGALDAPEVAKIFALVDRSHPDRPRRTRARVLAASGLTDADRAFLEGLIDLGEEAVPDDPLDAVRRLVAAGDYDPAWDMALRLPSGPQRASILIQCAVELGTPSAARAALGDLSALSATERDEQLGKSRRLSRDIEDLERLVVDPTNPMQDSPTESWEGWFRALHAAENWTEGLAAAKAGAREWDGSELSEGAVNDLEGLIGYTRTPAQQRILLNAAPDLLRWLDGLGPDPALLGVKMTFLEVVCLGEIRADVALETALALAESIIEAGISGEEYVEVLAYLETVWNQNASTRAIPWLIDTFEVLADLAGEPAALSDAATSMIAGATSYILRLDSASIAQLTEAAEAVGVPEGAVPATADAPELPITEKMVAQLRGATIGCYTLTPQVGLRVKAKLEQLFPGTTVTVNGDTESTAKLRNLAKSADYLIVMLRSAKHAATDAIGKHRPPTLPTLAIGCRGSAGTVARFVAAVSESS